MIIIGIILQYYESLYLFDIGRISLGQKVSAIASNSGIILLMLSDKARSYYKSNVLGKFFEYLGGNSLGIYLVHCYFVSLFSCVINIDIWGINLLLALCSTLIFILVAKRLFSKSIRVKLFGF